MALTLEPIGLKAPSFPSEAKSVSYVKKMDQSISLLCLAQGYDVPTFR